MVMAALHFINISYFVLNYFGSKSMEKKVLTCNLCDDRFSKFTDLELHIKENHEKYKEQECDDCE